MEEKINTITAKISLLKESRLQLLRLHKLLVDLEREKFETLNGQVSSGQFLNILLNDKAFAWLRKFSVLIAEIDEMLDLDDGYSENMVEKHLSQMRELIGLQTSDEEFNEKYKNLLQTDAKVAGKHSELKKLLA